MTLPSDYPNEPFLSLKILTSLWSISTKMFINFDSLIFVFKMIDEAILSTVSTLMLRRLEFLSSRVSDERG